MRMCTRWVGDLSAWLMEGYLRSWQMDIPDGSNDLYTFVESVYSKTHDKMTKELLELRSRYRSERPMIC